MREGTRVSRRTRRGLAKTLVKTGNQIEPDQREERVRYCRYRQIKDWSLRFVASLLRASLSDKLMTVLAKSETRFVVILFAAPETPFRLQYTDRADHPLLVNKS